MYVCMYVYIYIYIYIGRTLGDDEESRLDEVSLRPLDLCQRGSGLRRTKKTLLPNVVSFMLHHNSMCSALGCPSGIIR